MGELDAGFGNGRSRLAAFLHNLGRRLVLPQAAKGGVPKIAVTGPGAKLNLRHQFRFYVDEVAARIGRELAVKRALVLLLTR